MSEFYTAAKKFCNEFELTPKDQAKVIVHYPLFKLAWLSRYGTGHKQAVAKYFIHFFRNYSFHIKIKTKGGPLVLIPISFHVPDLDSFLEIFWGGTYSSPFAKKSCQSFVDLGANTGMASFYFLNKYQIQNAILVEANPTLARNLRKQMPSTTDTRKITIEQACVTGTAKDPIDFFLSNDHRMSSIYAAFDSDTAPAPTRISAIPLRALLAKHDLQKVDLLKMDIEGAEFDILDNDPSVFKSFSNIYAEVHGDDAKRAGFSKSIAAQGFEILERRQLGPECEIMFASQQDN